MPRHPEDAEPVTHGRRRALLAVLGDDSGRRQRRATRPSRRAATIAAVTTGTIAASTAAFALPDGGDTASLDPGLTHDAAMSGHLADDAASALEASVLPLAREMGAPTPVFTDVSISADKSSILPNGQVVLTVRAREVGSGVALAGQRIRIVVANGPKWQDSAALTTDANGTATISTRLLASTTVTAVFDGANALRPSLAGAATITVKDPPRRRFSGSGGSVVDMAIPRVVPGSSYGEKAVYLATLQKGKPYVYGSEGPYSFDCSGLVQYVFKQLGKYLPRTAEQQFRATARVPQSGKQPGDLIFFGSPGAVGHVGIYAGNGYMWAAPQTGGVVSLRPIYSSRYMVGRVL
jgi:cell wall-associated NlpC family hydrolase